MAGARGGAAGPRRATAAGDRAARDRAARDRAVGERAAGAGAGAGKAQRAAMTGNDFRDLVAAYIHHQYASLGLVVYREVNLGKTIIAKDRQIDVFVVRPDDQRAIAIECKYQDVQGTADEKIPYALDDLAALWMPGCLVYAGRGWSKGVLHQLERGQGVRVGDVSRSPPRKRRPLSLITKTPLLARRARYSCLRDLRVHRRERARRHGDVFGGERGPREPEVALDRRAARGSARGLGLALGARRRGRRVERERPGARGQRERGRAVVPRGRGRRRSREVELEAQLDLDNLIVEFLQVARRKGFSLAEIQSRVKHWLRLQPPDHFLVIDPDPEFREILMAEIRNATGFRTLGVSIQDCENRGNLVGAVPVALYGQAEIVSAALPPKMACACSVVALISSSALTCASKTLAFQPRGKNDESVPKSSRSCPTTASARLKIVGKSTDEAS